MKEETITMGLKNYEGPSTCFLLAQMQIDKLSDEGKVLLHKRIGKLCSFLGVDFEMDSCRGTSLIEQVKANGWKREQEGAD